MTRRWHLCWTDVTSDDAASHVAAFSRPRWHERSYAIAAAWGEQAFDHLQDLAETAITDESYRPMTTFFRQARQHLAPGGRMLIFFGTSGDMGYLKCLNAEEGSRGPRQRGSQMIDGIPVEYVTFKAT